MTPIEYGLVLVAVFVILFMIGWILVSLGVQIEDIIMFIIMTTVIFGVGVLIGKIVQHEREACESRQVSE